MGNFNQKWIKRFFLFFLLALAFILRIQQIYHIQVPDEIFTTRMALQIFGHPFPVAWIDWPGYPPFFSYFNFFFSFIMQKFLIFAGLIHFKSEYISSDFGYTLALQMGRVISALLGTLIVYLIFWMGKKFYNEKTGFAAAVLIAFNPYMIENSHIFKPDILLALLLTLMLYQMLRYVQVPGSFPFFWGAFFLGLAAATKYNGAVEALLLVTAILMLWKQLDLKTIRNTVITGLIGGFLGFAAGAPNWLIHPLKNFKEAYQFTFSYIWSFTLYEERTVSYSRYIGDFIHSFGWILFIFFILGIFLAFAKKSKRDILVFSYIAIYFGILGKSNFYSNRVGLPLFGAAAIVIAKTLFQDLPGLLARFPKIKKTLLFGAMIYLTVFSIKATDRSLRQYNLLAFTSQFDQSVTYRTHHLTGDNSFASETFTPYFKNDERKWDITRIPLKRFKESNQVDFITTGLLSDYILKNSRNQRTKIDLLERLKGYKPFYYTGRPRFGAYDGGVTFWYRVPSERRTFTPPKADLGFPRCFSPPDNPPETAFLPLQTYEKNPLWGALRKGLYRRSLYSTRRINKLKFYLFFPDGPSVLRLIINGKEYALESHGDDRFVQADISGLRPQSLQFDYVYKLEIIEPTKTIPCHFVIEPVYDAPEMSVAIPSIFSSTDPEEIPELFSTVAPPAWSMFYLRHTGIDLSLLTFLNRTELFRNDDGSTADVRTDYFPLEKGCYSLNLTMEKLVPGGIMGSGGRLKWTAYSTNGEKTEETRPLQPPKNGLHLILKMKREDPLAFIQFAVENLRANNILLRGMTIQPDYREWLMHGTAPPGR